MRRWWLCGNERAVWRLLGSLLGTGDLGGAMVIESPSEDEEEGEEEGEEGNSEDEVIRRARQSIWRQFTFCQASDAVAGCGLSGCGNDDPLLPRQVRNPRRFWMDIRQGEGGRPWLVSLVLLELLRSNCLTFAA